MCVFSKDGMRLTLPPLLFDQANSIVSSCDCKRLPSNVRTPVSCTELCSTEGKPHCVPTFVKLITLPPYPELNTRFQTIAPRT